MTPEVAVWVESSGNRVECVVLSASIFHGRDDPMSQPSASTVTLEILGPLPTEAVIGAAVGIDAIIDSVVYPRFRGEVSDLQVEWASVDTPTPRIIATGALGRIARRVVGDEPFPQELDGARVNRVLTLAGYPPEPALTDPGVVQVLARDVDAQPAQTLAHETANDGAGVVWEDVTGRLLYADALHRRGMPIAMEFSACDIGIGLTWTQSLEGIANDARVRYGVAPEGGEQPEVQAIDSASVALRGTYGVSLSTQIASEADAQKRADDIVARQSEPAWMLEGLEVNLALFQPEDVALLMSLDMHDLVSVTGLPAGSPATSALLWVEGWRESIQGVYPAGMSWVVALATSDYCRTGAAPRWSDLTEAQTWDDIGEVTWNEASCIPPQPSRGRWDDVASSLRWDQVTPVMEWDDWSS